MTFAEAFPDLYRLDPLDPVCQDRVHAFIIGRGGQRVWERTKAKVAAHGVGSVMLAALYDSPNDGAMILTWNLAMRAKRELLTSN